MPIAAALWAVPFVTWPGRALLLAGAAATAAGLLREGARQRAVIRVELYHPDDGTLLPCRWATLDGRWREGRVDAWFAAPWLCAFRVSADAPGAEVLRVWLLRGTVPARVHRELRRRLGLGRRRVEPLPGASILRRLRRRDQR